MNHGPLIFLAAFFGLAASWLGFVLTPQMQVGQQQPTNGVPAGVRYPLGRSGVASRGLDVYRANGCMYCHSQQVVQTGTICDVLLSEPGTNQATLLAALQKVRPGLSETEAQAFLSGGSKEVLSGTTKMEADAAAKTLGTNGAKAQVWIRAAGPDIARGWGKRRSMAQDFLFDYPVMPGSLRAGPDLANVGARLPDPNWHLRHLYAPSIEVKGSTMPAYHFLFEKRKIERNPSPDALQLPKNLAPPPGYEIVPKADARALAAYLTSLRTDEPLFEAPFSVASAPSTETNAPAGEPSSTNTPALGVTNAPASGATNVPTSTVTNVPTK